MKDNSKFDNVKTETEVLREEFESRINEFIDNAINFCIRKEAVGFRLSTLDKSNPSQYKKLYSDVKETDFEYKEKLEDIWSDEKYSHFATEETLRHIVNGYENEGVKLIAFCSYSNRFFNYYVDLDIKELMNRKNIYENRR